MSIFEKLLKKSKEEKAPPVEVEVTEETVEAVEEAPIPEEVPIPEEKGEVVDLPEGQVNRVKVEYIPAPPRDLIHDPDSNEKGKDEKSYL